jgi:LysR family transcriptional regulator, nitrogen assimilation regulatory protein
MNFADLHAFAVVARLSSFSRAATQLRIAQSALSRRVKRLEYTFSTTLLERHSRGAIPTEAGRILLKRIEALESELKLMQHDLLPLKDSLVGEISLALPHGVIQFIVSNIIENYRERCPDVKLRIIEGKSADNYRAVVNGMADAAMIYNPEPGTEVTVLPLYFERLLIIGPIEPKKDFAGLRGLDAYPAPQLAGLPLILPSRANSIRHAVENLADRLGIKLNVSLEVDGLSALKTLVKNGLGYTLLSNGPVHLEITAGSVTATPIADPGIEFPVGLIHRTDRRTSRPLTELTAVIQDIVHDLPPTGFWRPADAASDGFAHERWRQSLAQWPDLS